jgi:hypothetical protein
VLQFDSLSSKQMKRHAILPLLILFIMIFSLSTSCKKDEQKADEALTISSLYGSWAFMSLEFNGKTTYGCDSTLNRNYDFITLYFYGVKYNFWSGKSVMTLDASCLDIGDAPWQKDYTFTFADSVINCNDEWKFKLLNISPFEFVNSITNANVQSKKMTVKLIYSSIPDVPLNGNYTLGRFNL